MPLITNTFTLGGTTAALTLTANKDYKTDFIGTAAPTSYSNLVTIDPNGPPIDMFEGTSNEFAIVVNGAMLATLGAAPAGTDIRAAIDTVLQNSIDKVGGRNFVTKLIIDNVLLGASTTTLAATNLAGTAVTGSTITATNIDYLPESVSLDLGFDGAAAASSLNATQVNGLAKLFMALRSDPNIPQLSVFQVDTPFLGTGNSDTGKAYRFGGQLELETTGGLTQVASIVAKLAAATAGSSASLPFDAVSLNLFGQLENPPPIGVDVSALFPMAGYANGKVNISMDQLSAIANNNLQILILNQDGVTSSRNFIKVTDTAANINLLTADSANMLNGINNFRIFDSSGFSFWDNYAIQPWEINVSDLATKVNLDFGAAQVMAQNGWRMQLAASVDSTVVGNFGSITGEELAQAGRAGIDRLVFSNGISGTVTTVDPTKVAMGQVLIDQSSSWELAKLNVANLAGNANVDVVYAVDDSPPEYSFEGMPAQYSPLWFPQNIMTKMGVDRVIGKDGVLDIGLFDAQKLLAKNTMLGNAGDNTDVQVYIDNTWALGNLKPSAVNKLFVGGVDTLVFVGNGTDYDSPDQIDYSYSSAQTKNFIDSMGAAVRLGMNLDFGRYLGNEDGPTPYTVKLAVSGLALTGAGQNFVNIVNAIGDAPVFLATHTYSWSGQRDMELGISKSGIYDNWIEAKDFSGMSDATMGEIGGFLKTTARANLNGSLVVDAIGKVNSEISASGLFDLESFSADSLKSLGIQLKGMKNVYLDLRTSDLDPNEYGSSVDIVASADTLKKVSSGGFKGVIVDHSALNDWNTVFGETISTGPLSISNLAPTLDVVYQLDATDSLASFGLSAFVADESGYSDALKINSDSAFTMRLNTIDRIVITGAADGDMNIDLSGFGVTQENFAQKITRVGSSNSDFMMQADNGKNVGISIVGLTDFTKFTAADLADTPSLV